MLGVDRYRATPMLAAAPYMPKICVYRMQDHDEACIVQHLSTFMSWNYEFVVEKFERKDHWLCNISGDMVVPMTNIVNAPSVLGPESTPRIFNSLTRPRRWVARKPLHWHQNVAPNHHFRCSTWIAEDIQQRKGAATASVQ